MLHSALIRAAQQAAVFMTITSSPPGLQPEDYDEIEAALMGTRRGRSFLAEHARRSRSSDNARLLVAIERLEARLEAERAFEPIEASALAHRLDELCWSLRERGAEDFVCGEIAALAREIGGQSEAGHQPRMETASLAARSSAIAADRAETETPADDGRLSALSWLDRLPLVDRFALFS
jgi:hypothetical protein